MRFYQRCETVSQHLHPHLLSKQNADKLLQSVSLIHPSICPNYFLFESCINNSESNLDFGFMIKKNEMDNFRKFFDFNDFVFGCKNREFIDFLKLHQKNQFVRKNIPWIWVAFDLRNTSIWPPQPNLYLRLIGSAEERIKTIETVFCALKQKAMCTKIADLLPNFFSDDIAINHFGFLLARPSGILRITPSLSGLLQKEHIVYFSRLGLHGLDDYFASLFEKLKLYLSGISFEFDVENKVFQKFGVNCFVSQKGTVFERKRIWSCFLSTLASEGLVDEKKQNELLEWCGYHLEFETRPARLYFDSPKFTLRDISHIKIVFSSQQTLEAKAYLSCYYHETTQKISGKSLQSENVSTN